MNPSVFTWGQACAATGLDLGLAWGAAIVTLFCAMVPARAERMLRRQTLWTSAMLCAYSVMAVGSMTDPGWGEWLARIGLVLTQTGFGHMQLVALAGCALLALAGWWPALTQRGRQSVFALGLIVLLLARAASGHVMDVGFFSLALLAHAAHIGAACVWVGSVCLGVWLLRDSASRGEILAQRLSRLATWSLVAVFATGLLNVERLLSPWPGMQSPYVELLGGKLALVLLAVGLGAANRWYYMARMPERAELALTWFGRVLRLEAGLLLLVLACAARLGMSMPA